MFKIFTVIILLFLSHFTFSQVKANIHFEDTSRAIKNAQAKVYVTQGKAPFRYYWSVSGASIYQDKIGDLNEGMNLSVLVVDVNNDSLRLAAKVPANGPMEHMESVIKPMVDFIGENIFFKSIYSKQVLVDSIYLTTPNYDSSKVFKLVRWLVDDNSEVVHEQPVAEIMIDTDTIFLYAVGSGRISFLVQPGDKLFKQGSLNKSARNLARITYSEKSPYYNPNHTTKTSDVPLIVVWLVLGAIFFTFRMGFINVRGIKHSIQLVRGQFDRPEDKGEVSHFQALVTALSGTVGLGNIAGVAIAISLGGAGATFWMIVAGLLGMSSKFVECTLGVKYRTIDKDGVVSGGPMYYLSIGLAKMKLSKLGKVLAIMFAILCIGGSFGGGNMFQVNQAFAQASNVPGLEWIKEYGFVFGLIMALLVGIVIIGGIKSIAKVTDKIVPFMVGVYVLSALAIIGLNISELGSAFRQIIDGAFNASAINGGIIGVIIVGFKRAAFSNEAGVGSASIAHSAAKTEEPVSEGLVALLEPFIDTVVVCTMTALVLIFTGFASDTQGFEGSQLTSKAFEHALGSWSIYVLAIAAVLFAFSTMISWSYYGLKAWTYVFGNTKKMENAYKIVFLMFVVLGSSVALGSVLDFSDMMILAMAFPNILGLFLLSGEVRADLKDYFQKLKSGEIVKYK
jgi:alanine or glycine:cation symporter, AGCS family